MVTYLTDPRGGTVLEYMPRSVDFLHDVPRGD